ncbi:MAG: glycosyltransferase family 2 protein [Lysobacteraceae bacterium]
MSITVVVPVYNAAPELARCLDSLSVTLSKSAPVLLCDDASPDQRVTALLDRFCSTHAGARVVRRTENLGFVGNVNAAVAETGGDLVLLNSDAVVTKGWLEALQRCVDSDPWIATATPWSNNAEICSFPRFCENNPEPDDVDAIVDAAESIGQPAYPDLPTAVGFCMYLRRAALDAIGDFDQATFGRGYGEENDWCLRASGHGWRHVLCDDAYVIHAGGASFSAEGHSPGGENLRRLLARYPGYNELIADFILRDPLKPLRQRLHDAWQQRRQPAPQRDLFNA